MKTRSEQYGSQAVRSRTENSKRIIMSAVLQLGIYMLVPFVLRTAITYSIGAIYNGLNGVFTSIFEVLNLAELGFGEAVVFSMYKPFAEHDEDRICALLKLYKKAFHTVGAVIAALGLCVMPFLRFLIKGEIPADVNIYILYLISLAEVCIGYFGFNYKRALFTADQRGDKLNLLDTIIRIAELSLRLLALYLLRSFYAYCAVTLITVTVSNLRVNTMAKRVYPQLVCRGEISAEEKSGFVEKLKGLFVNRLCVICRNSFDSLTVSAFLGLSAVAIFQNYYCIINAVTRILLVLSASIRSSIGNSIANETQEKNYGDFRKLLLLFMWITAVFTACLLCLFQPFMELWMGREMLLSNAEMLLYCVYFFVNMMGLTAFVYREGSGLFEHRRYMPIVESAVNITLNILFIKPFGMVGVLISTVLCQLFINIPWSAKILHDFYFTDHRRTSYFLRLALYAAITAAGCGAAWYCCMKTAVGGIAGLLVKGAVCVAVSNAVALPLFSLFPEFRPAAAMVTGILKAGRKGKYGKTKDIDRHL